MQARSGGIHWWIGTVLLILSLLSGAYMRWFRDPPVSMLSDTQRAVYRSRHLFLLMAALVNLAMSETRNALTRRIVLTISALVPVLLLIAFVVEPQHGIDQATFSSLGLYLFFGAAVIWVLEGRPRGAG